MARDRWAHLPGRTPVVVGVGVASQRVDDPTSGDDAFALMVAAARAAGADSGSPSLLPAVDVVAVPEGSWSHANAAGLVGDRIGAPSARTVVVQVGIPQQTLLNDACAALLAGTAEVALVVGGEAAARARAAEKAGIELVDPTDWPAPPDELRSPEGEIVAPLEIEAGLWTPAEEYALIDSALRHAEVRTVAEHRDEISALWSRFSAVGAGFPHAVADTALDAAAIRDESPENPMIAFPYTRRHCSRLHVDQAAAILVTTLARARAAGIDPDRVVVPRVALESSASIAVIRRRDLHRWPAMRVLGERAAQSLGRPLTEVDHVELYSCFPAAVRVQQHELGLPAHGTPTITGGMAFAGGPWNSFVLQATAAMVDTVRADPSSLGMVTTVSGFLHKPGLAVYSTDPGTAPVEVADEHAAAAAETPTRPVASSYSGTSVVAACTIGRGPFGERRLVTLLDTPDRERWVGFSTDPELLDAATTHELVGTGVAVDGTQILSWDGPAGH